MTFCDLHPCPRRASTHGSGVLLRSDDGPVQGADLLIRKSRAYLSNDFGATFHGAAWWVPVLVAKLTG